MHVFVLVALTFGVAFDAETSLLVDGTVGGPGLVEVRAHLPAGFGLYRTLGDADALWFSSLVYLADLSGSASHL